MQERERVISLSGAVRALRQRIVWLALLPLAAGLLALAVLGLFVKDTFTAQARLYVRAAYVDAQGQTRFDTSAALALAADCQRLIQTPDVLADACGQMGFPSWPESLAIEVAVQTGTRVLDIGVTSRDAVVSMEAANALSDAFVRAADSLLGDGVVCVASRAVLPQSPSNRGRFRLAVLACVAVLISMAGTACVGRVLRDPVEAGEDTRQTLQVRTLARIRACEGEAARFEAALRRGDERPLEAVAGWLQERVRGLAYALRFVPADRGLRTLTVTSAMPGEGKSAIAMMLACQCAGEGSRVLVVGLDGPLPGENSGGTADAGACLTGKAALNEAVAPARTPNLFVACRRERAGMALSRAGLDALDRMLEEARQGFDLVVIDAPPLSRCADAAAVSARTDGTLMVVADGRTRRRDLCCAIGQLQDGHATLLGVVFNFASRSTSG